MTIIKKSLSERKRDKKEVTLVINEETGNYTSKTDLETATETEPQHFVLRTRARRVSAVTACLFLTALLIMSIGNAAGSQLQPFRGWLKIPYEDTNDTMHSDDKSNQNGTSDSSAVDSDLSASGARVRESDHDQLNDTNKVKAFFKEKFDLEIIDEDFKKIDLPNCKEGRHGTVLQDLIANRTAIVDSESQRCFVLPLDSSHVLPQRGIMDLIKKMWYGDSDSAVDTNVVRVTMRVVVPPIKNLRSVGHLIAYECKNLTTYMLELVTSPVF